MTKNLAPPEASGESRDSMTQAARGSSINLVGAFVTALATFAMTVAVTRGTSRSAAGVFFSTTSVFLLATTVGQLGTGTSLVYFMSRCRAFGTLDLIRAYLKAAVRPVIITALVMAVAIFVLAPEIGQVTNPAHAGQAATYLRVLAIFIPFAGLENMALAATRGLGTMRANALVEQIARPVIQLLLIVGAVSIQMNGLLGWAWALGYAPAAIVSWGWWQRLRPQPASDRGPSVASKTREFWRFNAPRSLASVAQQAMQRLDIILVGAFSGAVQAAIYAAATRFVVAGQMSRQAVSLAVQPPLAKALTRKDHADANHLYQVSTAWLMAVTWPLYLVLAVFGETMLRLFGSGYHSGSIVLLLLSLSMLVATFCGDVDIVLIMAGRTSWSLGNMTLALCVNLGLDLFLIPKYGVPGAAIGWAVAIVVKNGSAVIQVGIALHLHPVGRATTICAISTMFCFGLIPLAFRLALGLSISALFASVVIGSSFYLAVIWRYRLIFELGTLRKSKGRQPRHRRAG